MDPQLLRLGKILIAEGIVLDEDIRAAVRGAGLEGTALAEALAGVSHIRAPELACFLAADYRVPRVASLEGFPRPGAAEALPWQAAEHLGLVPLCRVGELTVVAFVEEPVAAVVAQLRRRIGGKIKVVRSSEEEVRNAIRRAYGVPAGDAQAMSAAAMGQRAALPAARTGEAAAEALEPIRLSREEFDRLAREYGEPVVKRWEKLVAGDGPLAAVRIR